MWNLLLGFRMDAGRRPWWRHLRHRADSTIVEFAPNGTVIHQWDIRGKCDGLTADPYTGRVIATVNETRQLLVSTPRGRHTHYSYSKRCRTTAAPHLPTRPDAVAVAPVHGVLAGSVYPRVLLPGAPSCCFRVQASVLGTPGPAVTPTDPLYNVVATPARPLRESPGGRDRPAAPCPWCSSPGPSPA